MGRAPRHSGAHRPGASQDFIGPRHAQRAVGDDPESSPSAEWLTLPIPNAAANF